MLFAEASQVNEQVVEMKVAGGELRTKQVLGQNSSMMIAARSGGYHSEPHAHDCEQLNYVQSGEIWVFIEDTAYHLRTGDFLRIPPNAVHWAWNRSDASCELIEMHTPGLILDGIDAPRLVADGETCTAPVPSRWHDKSYWDSEAEALAAHGVTR
ncbi:cupin domain-containing protein [Actinomadura sp.]|jgi:quercetin dioxygenase-like cupin family protein|uniref:cupin domain-containing protein n=1 Tax=Actinomadura sp. TaxID=1989 RepID=UPI003350ED6B